MERISYESLMNTINADNNKTVFTWNEMDIEVKRFLNMEDTFTFVNHVSNSCFGLDDGKYRPEVKDFVVRSCILEIYANFELPNDVAQRYDLVYQTDVIPEIMRYVDKGQFNAVMDAIDSKIDERLNVNVEKFNRDLRDASEMVDNLLMYIKDIFDGIDNDTVKKIAGSISEMKLDPNEYALKVVEANTAARKAEEEAKAAERDAKKAEKKARRANKEQ